MLRIRRKTLFQVLVVLAVILWAVGGTLWYTNVYMNKERRFWAAIGNGLRTASVTKEVIQDNPNGTTTQLSRMNFGPTPFVDSKTKVFQRTTTITESTIITSTLDTPQGSFVQYDQILTNEKKSDGSDFDFSGVINTWASRSAEGVTDEQKKQSLAENYIQLVPFANLDEASARDFVQRLQATNAYTVDFKDVDEDSVNDLTVYKVTVNAKAYVVVLSDIFKELGFGEVPALDASQYDETSSIKIQLAIDGTNIVRKIAFSNEEYETYRDYGAHIALDVPQNPISFADLQTRLQSTR